MADPLVGQHAASQVAHYLMHLDQDAPGFRLVESHRFDVRINLAPLLGPIRPGPVPDHGQNRF
jgi:hypothetical protein